MLDVLLLTEGTYPYTRGGVGTWCDTLVRRVQGVRYHVMAVVATPFVPMRFKVPPHVQAVLAVPLWGTEEPTEHLDLPYATIYDRRQSTTSEVIRNQFLPLFDRLLDQLWLPEQDGAEVAQTAWEMYRYFQRYDYLTSFKSEEVWERFRTRATERTDWPTPTIRDLLQGLGWVYRFMTVLTTPLPRVDVTHASAAAFCALPAVIAKLEHGTPMILTQHGIYLREQYLSIGKSDMSPFGKRFLLGMVGAVSRTALWAADQISPVAAYNIRWESQLGASNDRFKVIYNGVDPTVFQPRPRPSGSPLTVVSVARIDPIKDLETLMRAAAIVRREMPEVKFAVYGSVSVQSYYEKLLALRKELRLGDSFTFAGHVESPAVAYQSGDVVALSSISEGFPYAVVEAMMSGRAVVATDVGGTAEALGDWGLLVPPQQPEMMAEALLKVLADPQMRRQMAEESYERALSQFTVDRQVELYMQSYLRLAGKLRTTRTSLPLQVYLERAEGLAALGEYESALLQLEQALVAYPDGPHAPLLLLRIAQTRLAQGHVEAAWLASEQAEALAMLLEDAA